MKFNVNKNHTIVYESEINKRFKTYDLVANLQQYAKKKKKKQSNAKAKAKENYKRHLILESLGHFLSAGIVTAASGRLAIAMKWKHIRVKTLMKLKPLYIFLPRKYFWKIWEIKSLVQLWWKIKLCFGFVNFENPCPIEHAVQELDGEKFDDKEWYVGTALKKSEREFDRIEGKNCPKCTQPS